MAESRITSDAKRRAHKQFSTTHTGAASLAAEDCLARNSMGNRHRKKGPLNKPTDGTDPPLPYGLFLGQGKTCGFFEERDQQRTGRIIIVPHKPIEKRGHVPFRNGAL